MALSSSTERRNRVLSQRTQQGGTVDHGAADGGSIAPSRRPPAVMLALSVLVGVVFMGPFAYVVSRNLDLGTDLGSLLLSQSTWDPLRRSLLLGFVVAGSTAVIGTSLAWLTDPHGPLGPSHLAYPCPSTASLPELCRGDRPNRRLCDRWPCRGSCLPARHHRPSRHERLSRDLACPHLVHLSLCVSSGSSPHGFASAVT